MSDPSNLTLSIYIKWHTGWHTHIPLKGDLTSEILTDTKAHQSKNPEDKPSHGGITGLACIRHDNQRKRKVGVTLTSAHNRQAAVMQELGHTQKSLSQMQATRHS